MKLLSIIWEDLKEMFRRQTFLSVLLILGILVCDLMALYFWGNLSAARKNFGAPEYTVLCPREVEADPEKLIGLFDSYGASYEFRTFFDLSVLEGNGVQMDIPAFQAALERNAEYGPMLTVVGVGDYLRYSFQKGNSSGLSRPGTAALPGVLMKDQILPQSVTLDGKEYTPVGLLPGTEIMTSADTFLERGLYPDLVSVTLPADKADRAAEFAEELNVLLPAGCTLRREPDSGDENGTGLLIGISVAVFGLSVMALMYLVSSLFDNFSYECGVYYLIGAGKGQVIAVLCGVQLAILVVTGLLAVLVHRVLYQPLFQKINLFPVSYSAGRYFLYIALAVLLVFIPDCINIWASVHDSPIVFERRNEK